MELPPDITPKEAEKRRKLSEARKEYIRKKTCVSLLRTVAALLISLPKASQIMKGQPSVLTLQMKTGIIWETSIML